MIASNRLVQSLFLPALPSRALDAHKGNFGSVAIVGGDTGMVGSVLLAARAALFCGAGRVYAAFLAENAPNVDTCHPEIMLHSAATLTNLTQLNCVVIGTGLGQSKTAVDLLAFCMAQEVALLIDADALNLISQHTHLQAILNKRPAERMITPHPAEAARLLNTTVAHIQQNRVESAQRLANQFKVICVLKGAGSVIASADGDWFINTTGNAGLASGGTGDVLSGIIGSLVAQGLSGLQAAKLGVYVHGAAADALVAEGIGPVGLTASEVAQEARKQINLLNKLAYKNLKIEDKLN
ncbi:MAG: NAD(P)H-hydrate dehydratase [Bdellovibrio sp.]|nr:NAD(P)H-hydrate dehydratase [Methylotenera sp.]